MKKFEDFVSVLDRKIYFDSQSRIIRYTRSSFELERSFFSSAVIIGTRDGNFWSCPKEGKNLCDMWRYKTMQTDDFKTNVNEWKMSPRNKDRHLLT